MKTGISSERHYKEDLSAANPQRRMEIDKVDVHA